MSWCEIILTILIGVIWPMAIYYIWKKNWMKYKTLFDPMQKMFLIFLLIQIMMALITLIPSFRHGRTLIAYINTAFFDSLVLSFWVVFSSFHLLPGRIRRWFLIGTLVATVAYLLKYYDSYIYFQNGKADEKFFYVLVQLINFCFFIYGSFCVFNLLWIINKDVVKTKLVMLDYSYLTLALIALSIKYFSGQVDNKILDNIAFVIGAVAIALRFTKTNGDMMMEYNKSKK